MAGLNKLQLQVFGGRRYVFDAVTDLAVSSFDGTSISIFWTAPASTYSITHYEIYLDGIYLEDTTTNAVTWTISSLDEATNYLVEIYAVNSRGDRNAISNTVIQQTSITGFDFLQNLLIYSKFNGNANDYLGVHNGTATGVSYVAGQVNDCVEFSADTHKINYGDNDLFSFTNGIKDVAFTIVLPVRPTDKTTLQFPFNKRTATLVEYHIVSQPTGELQFRIGSSVGGNDIGFNYPAGWTLNVWNHLVITYNGSKVKEGFRFYINGTEVFPTLFSNGDYTGTFNQSSNLAIGNLAYSASSSGYYRGRMDEFAMFRKRALTLAEVEELADRFALGNPMIA